jgi:hypothetical protein
MPPGASVDIRDIQFRMGKEGLAVECKLANNLAEQGRQRDIYIYMQLTKTVSIPLNGINMRKGSVTVHPQITNRQEFLIQRFKTYHRQYKMLSDFELPSFIRILVYDRSGQKILEKEIPVIDVPANE